MEASSNSHSDSFMYWLNKGKSLKFVMTLKLICDAESTRFFFLPTRHVADKVNAYGKRTQKVTNLRSMTLKEFAKTLE